ncbi:putative UBP1-associated protein 2A [Iris pallida]|uniref:UBP1-associated protein 2A n=1 Tax=Iris pallida TaxID=29817 RepID=A0AAX6EHS8_IRIPA|nr:putative UBP1-associated protein 2A [Iris pallida]
MARKRKLANTKPEPEPEPVYEPEPESEEEEELVEEEEEEEDDDEEEEEEDEDEEEEEEEEEDERPPPTAANGSRSVSESAVRELLSPLTKDQMIFLLTSAALSHPSVLRLIQATAATGRSVEATAATDRPIEVAAADDRTYRDLFVLGFGLEATYESLQSFFSKYGEIENVHIVTDKPSGRPKGYAFVCFRTRAAAEKALSDPNKTLGNRTITCQLAALGRTSGSAAFVPPKAPQAQASLALQATGNNPRKIYVRNVAPEIDPKKLLDYFSMFGDIEEGPLGMDTATGRPRGWAMFVYKTVEGARRALEQPHKTFEGHSLHCSISTSSVTGKVQMLNNNHLVAAQPQAATRPMVPPATRPMVPPPLPAAGAGYSQPTAAAPPMPAVNAGMNPPLGQAAGLDPALGRAVGQAVGQALTAMGLTNLLGGLGGAVANQGVQAPVANTAVPQVHDGYRAGAQVQGGYGPGNAVDNRYGAGTGVHNRYVPGATGYGGYGVSTGVHGGHGAGTMEYGGYGAGTVAQSGYGVSSHVQGGGYGSPAVGQGGAGRGYPQGGYGGYGLPPPYR